MGDIRCRGRRLLSSLVLLALIVPVSARGESLSLVEVELVAEAADRLCDSVVSADGRNLYAACYDGYNVSGDDDPLLVFSRDLVTGALTLLEVQSDLVLGITGLAGADGAAISPDDAHVYATGLDEDSLVVFARNPVSGALAFVEVHEQNLNGDQGLSRPIDVVVSPDGQNVYTTEVFGGVGVYARNPSTGALTFVEYHATGGGGEMTVSPDGQHIYVPTGAGVSVFARNPTTGALTPAAPAPGQAQALAISPDGLHVYTTGSHLPSSINTLARNPVTGALSPLQTLRVPSFEDQGGSLSLGMRADGAFLFAGVGEIFLSFARDTSSGYLTPHQLERQGVCAQTGLTRIIDIATSSDALNVYVASLQSPGALSVFGGGSTSFPALCASAPRLGCREAGKSGFLVRDDVANDVKDKMIWKWLQGAATDVADFGDPRAGTTTAVCIYAGTTLIDGIALPADSTHWTAKGGQQFVFKDPARCNAGVVKVILRSGGPGLASIKLKAGGVHLQPGTPASLMPPVSVQIVNDDNASCWNATYDTADVQASDPDFFKARR